MRILFVDPVCNKQYDPNVLLTEPLGGTEATITRLAEGMAELGHSVRVTQHNRQTATKFKAEYTPFKENADFKATHVIVLRSPNMLRVAQKQYPKAKLYLHCHDLFDTKVWADGAQACVDTQAVPIFVSDWHKQEFYHLLQAINFKGYIPTRRIYNPIDTNLVPDETEVDKNKVVFFSSPHKGLEHTLKVFECFSNFEDLKDMKLHIANPGYFKDLESLSKYKNVVNLGPLPHSEVIKQVRSSLCVLHLNGVYPETFGLVHAEANAVGTPFLTSRYGANQETYDHPQELIDVMDNKAVIDRIISWKKYGRPKVRANPQFRLNKIVREWLSFLEL
jgi:glycosyltransferase involved in cell wall biosynthesis